MTMRLKYMALIVRVWGGSVKISKICVFQNFCGLYPMKIDCGGRGGYGALYGFMRNKNISLKKYFGYDISEVMIKVANEFIQKHNPGKMRNFWKIILLHIMQIII
ncbi:hypothetical protein [Helicobacter apodemus]|uniref:Uncharacterized protein n=1 Tax=Helicobacter apodemus TaxID=135569 RepID=A0A2U8FBY0_9HELI|nr:hypothetical protein [Helicobacter apodemus]AWI33518.1 hypothetical protein CDV25_01160 [Helicobacter apodemus]